ncbi:MAG: transglycosylase SLT domain-containing protein [Alphaproteobacteria bacterium]|nr:transglycosylase SLT domain-containing protein [Alphaproteobacteria bacterium]
MSSAPALAEKQSAALQAQTLRGLEAVNRDKWQDGRNIFAGTKDAFASKLYFWLLFSRKDAADAYPQLAQFIRQNPDWPGVDNLKRKVERVMPGFLKANEVIAWYRDYPPETAEGVDRYAQALISAGRSGEARAFLSDWWTTTTLSRDDQRRIFRIYASYLDRGAHLRRFDTMLLREQNTNARALAQVLGAGYPELAEARIALAAEDPQASALIRLVPRTLQGDVGLAFERLRWRRKNNLDVEAMEILHHPPPIDNIQNKSAWWKEHHILIRRLMERHMYESAYLLAAQHFQTEGLEFAQAEWLAGWLALRFVNKPDEAARRFENLYKNVSSPVSRARAAYWAGRAMEARKNTEAARRWYEEAARYQTVFYGQLAAAELGVDYGLPHAAPPTLTADDMRVFESEELVQAAYLFSKAGMNTDSVRFIKAFIKKYETPKAYRFAVEMVVNMGRISEAVRISKDATNKGLFLTAQSYPVIPERLQGIDLEWSLVHAIIRQESMFDFEAKSPAGALGLMQLMPATATETAGKMGAPHQTLWLVSRPEHNIALGSRYLSDLLRRYDGSYPLAIAAYNAGPGRVNQWLKTFGDPRTGEVDPIDWIEMIPIYETRNYVQRVMEGVYVYRLRLKTIQKPPTAPIHLAMSQRNRL